MTMVDFNLWTGTAAVPGIGSFNVRHGDRVECALAI